MTVSDTHFITLGCRLNTYESEVMSRHAEAAGLTKCVVINSCAVTSAAVAGTRHAIRKAARDHPDADIIVTGCAAQIDPDSFAAMPEVSRVIGNHEKMLAETWTPATLWDSSEKVRVNDIMSVRDTAAHLIEGMGGRARAFVQVQNGCDHRCTFCIIPYGRGPSRSVPAGEIVDQVKTLVGSGHYEVVLTGVDLTSWGQDLPGTPPLGNLVQRILKLVPDLRQLRLSSIDAIEIDPDLEDAITSEPRIAPYLHLSLQHGDNLILKRMKRRHSREEAIGLISRLKAKRPDIAFGADFIAGFPTETDAAFENTLSLIDICGLAYIHAFPYSAREGTPAARMPPVAGPLIKSRAARLRETGQAALARHLSQHVGREAIALLESGGRARLPDFSPVQLTDNIKHCASGPVRVKLHAHDGKVLQGTYL